MHACIVQFPHYGLSQMYLDLMELSDLSIAGIETIETKIQDLGDDPTYTTTVPSSIGHTPDTSGQNPGQDKQMLESFSIMSKAATE